MTKGERQPISIMTVRIEDDVFWNWLADETQIDLCDLALVGANELSTGDVEIVVKRRERSFEEALTAHETATAKEDENDRFFREG